MTSSRAPGSKVPLTNNSVSKRDKIMKDCIYTNFGTTNSVMMKCFRNFQYLVPRMTSSRSLWSKVPLTNNSVSKRDKIMKICIYTNLGTTNALVMEYFQNFQYFVPDMTSSRSLGSKVPQINDSGSKRDTIMKDCIYTNFGTTNSLVVEYFRNLQYHVYQDGIITIKGAPGQEPFTKKG